MIFFYDRDCSFCRAAAGRLGNLAPLIDIAPLPLRHHAIFRAAGADELGHRAIGSALLAGGRSWWIRLAGRVLCLRPLDRLWGGVYRLVAANRARLPLPR